MALRNIVQEPNETLRKKCRKVEKITERILQLLDDMKETLAKADGVGLAAPQVGVLRRVVIIDVGEGPIELINPEILEAAGEQTGEEGCLSVAGRWGVVTRPNYVKVKAMDRQGKERIYEGEGLLARAFCHEIDHLDGRLFIDIMKEEITEDADEE
jgi:peptide deformylase